MSIWDIIKENGQKTIQTIKKALFKTIYFFLKTIDESYIYIKIRSYLLDKLQNFKTTSNYYKTLRLWKSIKRLFWQQSTVYEEYWCVMAYWCLWGCYSFLIGFALLILRPVLFLIWACFILLVSFTAMGHKIRTPHTIIFILCVFYPHYLHNIWIKQQKHLKKEDDHHCKRPELYLFIFIILSISGFLLYVVLQNRKNIKDFLEKFANTFYYLQHSKKYKNKAFSKICNKNRDIIITLISLSVFTFFKRVQTFFMLTHATNYFCRIKKQFYSSKEIMLLIIILKIKLNFLKFIKKNNFKKILVLNNYTVVVSRYFILLIVLKKIFKNFKNKKIK